jgi:hypothetical protein
VFEESKGRGSVKVCIRVYNFLVKTVLRLEQVYRDSDIIRNPQLPTFQQVVLGYERVVAGVYRSGGSIE